jgi:hypothetical protein
MEGVDRRITSDVARASLNFCEQFLLRQKLIPRASTQKQINDLSFWIFRDAWPASVTRRRGIVLPARSVHKFLRVTDAKVRDGRVRSFWEKRDHE